MSAPPFAYFGGKQMLASRIVGLMPTHETYVEPFAGSLAVLLAKPRSNAETVNDLDGDLVNFWTVLRDRGDELQRVCALTPHAREEHATTWAIGADVDPLERARQTWVQLTQNYGNQRHHKSGWRHMQGANVGLTMPRYLAAYVDRIAPCAERLYGVSLEHRPGLDVIRDYGQHSTTLLYVDPPYFASRSHGYRVEMTDTDEHQKMLAALKECSASVILSGYSSDMYDSALTDWNRFEIATGTGQGRVERAARTEVLWLNYEPATVAALFDLDDFGDAS
jgi:DNA adenine methylase